LWKKGKVTEKNNRKRKRLKRNRKRKRSQRKKGQGKSYLKVTKKVAIRLFMPFTLHSKGRGVFFSREL